MKLENEFWVDVSVDEAWAVLTDLERIAPCIPGAELQEVDGDQYRGSVKVKVGPMTARYQGVASFDERDDDGYRAIIRFEGRDARGQGTASAEVVAALEAKDGGTRASIHTDLKVTGKVAQFGRSVLADVSAKLLDQFVEALEADVLVAGAAPAASAAASLAAPATQRPEAVERPPVDLVATAGPVLLRRLLPLAAALALAGLLGWLLWRG